MDRKTNLKLDVTQLSALKKVFGSKDVDGEAIRGEEEEEVTGEGGEGGESTSVESEKGIADTRTQATSTDTRTQATSTDTRTQATSTDTQTQATSTDTRKEDQN